MAAATSYRVPGLGQKPLAAGRWQPYLRPTMTGPLDRLKAALADRYVIDREIGAGGMATVYLAMGCEL